MWEFWVLCGWLVGVKVGWFGSGGVIVCCWKMLRGVERRGEQRGTNVEGEG